MKRERINQLKMAVRECYAWPGGYEIIGVTTDGGLLCSTCMKSEFKQILRAIRDNDHNGWQLNAITTTADCEDFERCDHCNKFLDAYHDEGEETDASTV